MGAGALLAGTTSAFQVRRLNLQPTIRSISSKAPLAAFVNYEEGADRDIGSMDAWAEACGVQRADGFQLTTEDGMDWSAVTTQDLPEGSPVLFVPNQMVLSSSRVSQEFGGAADAAVDQLRRLGASDDVPQFYLLLKVLTIYEMREESPWFPWLNSLPRLFYNSASMTGEAIRV